MDWKKNDVFQVRIEDMSDTGEGIGKTDGFIWFVKDAVIGDVVEARVTKLREDGKLDLCPREKAYLQMDADSELVLKVIDEFDGVLPFNDKASPETIKREFHMSKNAFKRAVGHLLKEGKIKITDKTIERV